MPRSAIQLDEASIPVPDRPMPILKTEGAVIPSFERLNGLLERAGQKARFEYRHGETLTAFDGERLVGFVDPQTNETQIYPKLTGLKASNELRQIASRAAEEWAVDRELFPEDHTVVKAMAPKVLMGAHRTPKRFLRKPAAYLSYVTLVRHVEDIQVCGPGSKAMIAVAGDGSVQAMTHRWSPAFQTDTMAEPYDATRIAEAIRSQVATFAKSKCAVTDISLVYYDGGDGVLQPAYRFKAVKSAPKSDAPVADQQVVGYLAIGEEFAPLPKLGERVGKPPARPPAHCDGVQKALAGPQQVTVGRYVVRMDNAGWVTSANEFYSGLSFAGALFGGPLTFTNQQYYWAEPRLFTSQKDSFVNSVQVALTEVHGNWGLFSTLRNNADFVNLTDIPSTGYGPGGNGRLAYWIIHSCEVIPTATDETSSFDVWWTVFNGMHAVLGYRTEMWINDRVTGGFGVAVGFGAAVVPAWLQHVQADDDYHHNPEDMYLDGNRGFNEPMGRASAVNVYGHSDDTMHNLNNLGRPSTLTEWWFNN